MGIGFDRRSFLRGFGLVTLLGIMFRRPGSETDEGGPVTSNTGESRQLGSQQARLSESRQILQMIPKDLMDRFSHRLLKVYQDPVFNPRLANGTKKIDRIQEIESFRNALNKDQVSLDDLELLRDYMTTVVNFIAARYRAAEEVPNTSSDQNFLEKYIDLDGYWVEFYDRLPTQVELKEGTDPRDKYPGDHFVSQNIQLLKKLINDKALTPLDAVNILWGEIEGQSTFDSQAINEHLLRLQNEHTIKRTRELEAQGFRRFQRRESRPIEPEFAPEK